MSAPAGAPKPGRPAPIPLTVLTGFLGAGKTTLLNRVIKDPAFADTAVIINEFGEIGLDHLLVEHVRDGVVLLQSGCLCCTVRGDLVNALERLLRDHDNGRVRFRRMVVETTGLADPAPVLQTVMAHPYLVLRYRLDGVVTLVDAVNGAATLDQHQEAVKQVAVADRIVLSKADLLGAESRTDAKQRLTARLRRINPAAPILDAAAGEAEPAQLIACGLYAPGRALPDLRGWLAEDSYAAHPHPPHAHDPNRHDDRVRAAACATDQAVPAVALDSFLDLLRSLHGPNLLRFKGIVKLAETPERPLVLHGVQHVLHPPACLERWPDSDTRTRLVFITRDLDPRVPIDLFRAFMGEPAPDRPDRAALLENPLVPFGTRIS